MPPRTLSSHGRELSRIAYRARQQLNSMRRDRLGAGIRVPRELKDALADIVNCAGHIAERIGVDLEQAARERKEREEP